MSNNKLIFIKQGQTEILVTGFCIVKGGLVNNGPATIELKNNVNVKVDMIKADSSCCPTEPTMNLSTCSSSPLHTAEKKQSRKKVQLFPDVTMSKIEQQKLVLDSFLDDLQKF